MEKIILIQKNVLLSVSDIASAHVHVNGLGGAAMLLRKLGKTDCDFLAVSVGNSFQRAAIQIVQQCDVVVPLPEGPGSGDRNRSFASTVSFTENSNRPKKLQDVSKKLSHPCLSDILGFIRLLKDRFCKGDCKLAERDPKKPLAMAGGAIGLVSAIVGIATAPAFIGQEALLYTIGTGCAVATLYAGFLKFKQAPLLIVKSNLSDVHFNEAFALGNRVYNESLKKKYPEQSRAETWRSNYQAGVFQALDSFGRCWGYVSLWPFKQSEFQRICSYEICEDDIVGEMIENHSNAPFSYWYIADLCKDTKKFHAKVPNDLFAKYIAATLIRHALQGLVKEKQFGFPLQFVGIAVTLPGRNWLKKFDFQRLTMSKTITQPRDPVYTRCYDKVTMTQLIQKLRSEERALSKDIRKAMLTS